MPKPKSKQALERRLAALRERGVDPLWDTSTPLRDLLDVLGDLTPADYATLCELASAAPRGDMPRERPAPRPDPRRPV